MQSQEKEIRSVKLPKKGTSLYLKDLLDRQHQNSMIFAKSPTATKKVPSETEEIRQTRMFLPVEAFDPLLDIEIPEEAIR